MTRERQPRERPVPCQRCAKRSTFNLDAVCDTCAAKPSSVAPVTCVVCDEPLGHELSDDGYADERMSLTDDGRTKLVVEYQIDPDDGEQVCQSCMVKAHVGRWCSQCECYTFNVDHLCTTYDGDPCDVCGAGTTFYTVGAPGYGSGVVCRSGHRVELSPHGVLTPEQTR